MRMENYQGASPSEQMYLFEATYMSGHKGTCNTVFSFRFLKQALVIIASSTLRFVLLQMLLLSLALVAIGQALTTNSG